MYVFAHSCLNRLIHPANDSLTLVDGHTHMLQDLFRLCDAAGNGSIAKDEFVQLCEREDVSSIATPLHHPR